MISNINKNKEKLIDYLEYIKKDDKKRFAIYFNFSKLNDHSKNDYNIRIAINIINVFFKNDLIEIFTLENFDIVIIYENNDYNILEKLIYELRYLFIDDPLAFISQDIENPEFCSIYNLYNDWQTCFDGLYNNNLHIDNKKNIELDSSSLLLIEDDLINSNIFLLLRTQNIVALSQNNISKTVFAEIYVSIAQLFDQFNYKIEVNRNSLLFRYLTSILDIKVLEILKSRISNYIGKSISINLNVETILSETFHQFDQKININQKKSIIIEINIADVFIDISSFVIAKDYLQKLGYRVCLDGVNYLSFLQVDRESLGVDLMKLQWNPSYEIDINNNWLIEAVKKSGAHRIILCRCDSDEAIEFGGIFGISLFQGWHIDKLNLNISK